MLIPRLPDMRIEPTTTRQTEAHPTSSYRNSYSNMTFNIDMWHVTLSTILLQWASAWQNKMTCVSSKDSDQPVHPPSLTRIFAVRMKKPGSLAIHEAHSKDSDWDWMAANYIVNMYINIRCQYCMFILVIYHTTLFITAVYNNYYVIVPMERASLDIAISNVKFEHETWVSFQWRLNLCLTRAFSSLYESWSPH